MKKVIVEVGLPMYLIDPSDTRTLSLGSVELNASHLHVDGSWTTKTVLTCEGNRHVKTMQLTALACLVFGQEGGEAYMQERQLDSNWQSRKSMCMLSDSYYVKEFDKLKELYLAAKNK